MVRAFGTRLLKKKKKEREAILVSNKTDVLGKNHPKTAKRLGLFFYLILANKDHGTSFCLTVVYLLISPPGGRGRGDTQLAGGWAPNFSSRRSPPTTCSFIGELFCYLSQHEMSIVAGDSMSVSCQIDCKYWVVVGRVGDHVTAEVGTPYLAPFCTDRILSR